MDFKIGDPCSIQGCELPGVCWVNIIVGYGSMLVLVCHECDNKIDEVRRRRGMF